MSIGSLIPDRLFSCSFADGKIAGNMVKYS